MNYKVGAIIVTYNVKESLKDVYMAIINQVEKLVFVDNGSNVETINIINHICKNNEKCKKVMNDKNVGIGKALNQGVEYLLKEKMDFILTLDHDSKANKDMIFNMLKIYDEYKEKVNIGILTPAIYDINKKDYLMEKNNENIQIINEAIQSGELIRSDVFNAIGGFNEKLFIYYVDTDFNYRVQESGRNIVQCNNTILLHEEGQKTIHNILGKKIYYNNYNSFAIYYRARNNIYMIKKYKKSFTSKDRILKDFMKILLCDKNRKESLKAHLKGVKDGFSI